MQVILRSYTARLVPVTLMLLGFGLGGGRATAQTSYPISSYYDTTIYVTPITSDVSQVIESGISADAPYGLNQYDGLTYSKTNPTTGELTFNIDPTTFGLQDLPLGYITFGSGTNKVFGTSDATTTIDLVNLTSSGSGSVDITGGEGIFKNATGRLLFTEEDIIIPGEITTTLKGRALVYGSINTLKTVPEPKTTTTLIGIGMIGAGFLVRRHRLKSASC
ncbi:hypothetical protein [Scytonema sp. PCC 10023]|uniref:hypothetical protein n=1 Tax=Scytonema sp. PCC 10023 TaxID=1680591 RepID=UPI0039C62CB1